MTRWGWLALLLATGCGGDDGPARAPVQSESPADEVLRVGDVWKSTTVEQKIMSPPSPLSMFRTQRTSSLTFSKSGANEEFLLEEEVELRNGQRVRCSTSFSHALGVRWGRKNGEAALELVRPALQGPRKCNGPHPEPELSEPARRAVLVLRSDQLVVLEPATDKRQYIPVAY